MSLRTVKVSNVSLGANEREVKEFFSFSGDIAFLEMKKSDDQSQTAYVTFKDPKGAETAVLLTGATIVDKMVTIIVDPDYQLPPEALAQIDEDKTDSAYLKAEDVVSTMLARGFLLGKDAMNKAQSFDEKHQLSRAASAKMAAVDQKIGLSEKMTVVNEKVREVDQKYQVTEKTKSAISVAEQKVNTASSAAMKNRYVFTGAAWVTNAFHKISKAAGNIGAKTKEKVVLAEDEKKQKVKSDGTQVQSSQSQSESESQSQDQEVMAVPSDESSKKKEETVQDSAVKKEETTKEPSKKEEKEADKTKEPSKKEEKEADKKGPTH